MLYGTIVRTPTKRRFLGAAATPNKSRKVSKPREIQRLLRSSPPLTPPALLHQFNATSSSSSTTSNSTMRCAFGGTVCRSPLPRLPLSANKVDISDTFCARTCAFFLHGSSSLQAAAARTPGGAKPPHPPSKGCNKENEVQAKGTPLACASPLRNFSINSVASTYSEFVVILHFRVFSFNYGNQFSRSQVLMVLVLIYILEGPDQH